MPNRSTRKDDKARNTGHGALGMGGQPNDDPRDIERGGEGRTNNDLGGRTGPIPGAFGDAGGVGVGGGSAGDETVGPMGDKGITGDIDKAAEAARRRVKGEGDSGGA